MNVFWMFYLITGALFFIWVFFHEHLRFTGQQGKGEGIYLTSLYHFHSPHGPLDISCAIAAESSPLHIVSSRTRTRNFCFPREILSAAILYLSLKQVFCLKEVRILRYLYNNSTVLIPKFQNKAILYCTW